MGLIRSSRTEDTVTASSFFQRFEYTTAIVRSKMVGDRMDGSAVERELDAHAREGWQLKSVTETEVKGPHRARRHDGPAPDLRARHRPMTITTVHTEAQAQAVAARFPLTTDELIVDLRHLSPAMRAAITLADRTDDDLHYLETAAAHCATIISREAFLA